MKKHLVTFLILFIVVFQPVFAKKTALVQRLEPTFWWTGMKYDKLQLMFYGPQISSAEFNIKYAGVSVRSKVLTDNPNYVFLYLNIGADVLPGKMKIEIKQGKKNQVVLYELKSRKADSANRQSFTEADAIYLLMPDRFANGNTANDSVKGYFEKADRSNPAKRHGGDIDGIISKIPYLSDLGVTALWTTPLFDNNDSLYSYHHYGCTDYYKVDPRFGKNEDYPRMVDSCHKYGLKTIIDVVPNHCCAQHWWLKDKPAKNWFNEWGIYTSSNYRMTAWTDPHAAQSDLYRLTHGWFAPNMPDLNFANYLLFDYLRQVYVFWIEYAGIDGMRVDTYPYNDISIAAKFIQSIRDEYPNMNVVGECWVKTPAEIAYYQSGNNNKDGFDSRLTSVMDFCLKDVFGSSFNETDGWDTGLSRFYAHYAQDFVYPNLNMVMNFLDNHDVDRYSLAVRGDVAKFKMGLAMLLTTRGYPQIYYGTEIMLGGQAGSYEGARFDFPGGWQNDKRNAFTTEGRTAQENEIFKYTKTLLNYRKNNSVLQSGKMKQFIPENGVYVYARYNSKKTVLVIANNTNEEKLLNPDRFSEVLYSKTSGVEITSNKKITFSNPMSIPAKSVQIIEID